MGKVENMERMMTEKGCDNCYYSYFDEKAYPCSLCIRGIERTDMWQPSRKTKADRKTENCSEKTNNCEDWQDWKDRMWAEAIVTEPQTETEIAKAIVHKMIDDAVIAEDAYPDLRQKMHDAVDEYEPQTERSSE